MDKPERNTGEKIDILGLDFDLVHSDGLNERLALEVNREEPGIVCLVTTTDLFRAIESRLMRKFFSAAAIRLPVGASFHKVTDLAALHSDCLHSRAAARAAVLAPLVASNSRVLAIVDPQPSTFLGGDALWTGENIPDVVVEFDEECGEGWVERILLVCADHQIDTIVVSTRVVQKVHCLVRRLPDFVSMRIVYVGASPFASAAPSWWERAKVKAIDAELWLRLVGYKLRLWPGLYVAPTAVGPIQSGLDRADVGPESVEDGKTESRRAVLFCAGFSPDKSMASLRIPAGMFPLGGEPFVEAAIEVAVGCGITDIDLVLGESPDLFRARIGDGRRWGCRVRVHVVQDSRRPFGILQSILDDTSETVWIGHADQIVFGLPKNSSDVLWFDESQDWTGWAVTNASTARRIRRESEFGDVADQLVQLGLASYTLDNDKIASTHSAMALIRSQALARMHPDIGARISGTNADTLVGHGSVIAGNVRLRERVRIGRQCYIAGNSDVGPNVVIGDNVIVEDDCQIRDSVVLDGTFVGSNLHLKDAVVTGNMMIRADTGVLVRFANDFALISRTANDPRKIGLGEIAGRLMGASLLLVLSPVLLARMMSVFAASGTSQWPRRSFSHYSNDGTERVVTSHLRMADPLRWSQGLLSGLLDITEGKLAWFGPAARSIEQVQTLPEDWQQILLGVKPGLLHGSLMLDMDAGPYEKAMADVYQLVRPTVGQKFQMLMRAAARAFRID